MIFFEKVSKLMLLLLLVFIVIGCSTNNHSVSTRKKKFEPIKISKERRKEINREVYGSKLYFDNQIRWGISPEELKDKKVVYKNYRDYANINNQVVNYYYSSLSSNPYNIKEGQYWFYKDTNKLNSYMLTFDKYRVTYENYVEVKKIITEKYGEPTSEDMNYSDETYKTDFEKSIKYGYLKIKTTWNNQNDFDIVISWEKDFCYVMYCEKGYAGNY